jgi:predicted oxidoreductase (fatty acid repression mutant protein)
MSTSDKRLLKNFNEIEKSIYKAVKKTISSLNQEGGRILFDENNTEEINKINKIIRDAIQGSSYPSDVKTYLRDFDQVKEYNQKTHEELNGISNKEFEKIVGPIQKTVVDQTLEGLVGAGINTNFSDPLRNGLFQNIVSGTTFENLESLISSYILTDPDNLGRFKRYVGQISRDALNQYDGQVNARIAEDLDLNAFRYVGSLIEDSRPQCRRWVFKEILLKENLPDEIAWANNNGTGMIPGTDENNFAVYRGGYNCRHSAIPFKMTKSQREQLGLQEQKQEVEVNNVVDQQIKEISPQKSIDKSIQKIETQQSQTAKVADGLFYSSQPIETVNSMNNVLFNTDGVVDIINQDNVRIFLRNTKESTSRGYKTMKSVEGTVLPTNFRAANISKNSNGNCSTTNSFMNIKILKGEKSVFEKIDMNFNELDHVDTRLTTFNNDQYLIFNKTIVAQKKGDQDWKYWSVRGASNAKGKKNVAPTITHEAGHIFQNKYDRSLTVFNRLIKENELTLQDAPTLYGETNFREFWTESLTFYIYDNKTLKDKNPKVFKLVEQYFSEFNIDLKTVKLAP